MYERIQGNDMYDAGPNIPFSLQVNTPGPVELDNPRLSLGTGTAGTLPINPASITGLNRQNYKQPASYQWSLGIQRSLSAKTVLSVAYVGNTNRYQSDRTEYNLPNQAALIPIINGLTGAACGQPAGQPCNYNTAAGLPFPGFHSVRLSTNEANSHYHGLQLDVNSQVGRDLFLRAFYTYSKAIDPGTGSTSGTTGGSGGQDLQNVSNPYLGWRYDVGPSGFDRTHNAVVNFIYDIPLFRNNSSRLVKTALGGWQASGIVTIESGLPLNIGISGKQGGNALPNATNRPDLVGKISYPQTPITCTPPITCFQQIQYIDPSAFANPTVGAFGDLGHNALRGPGRDNWNLSLFKSFTFNEARGSRLELRLETFNAWNHTQFNQTSNNFGASDFGQFKSAFDPRILQLGGKIYF